MSSYSIRKLCPDAYKWDDDIDFGREFGSTAKVDVMPDSSGQANVDEVQMLMFIQAVYARVPYGLQNQTYRQKDVAKITADFSQFKPGKRERIFLK